VTAHLRLGGAALKRTAGFVCAEMVTGFVDSVLEYRGGMGGGSGHCNSSDEATSSQGVDEHSSICSESSDGSDEFDFDGMEAGSVACIYTQLVCVMALVVWLTVSGV
jgi:hypothetical protein